MVVGGGIRSQMGLFGSAGGGRRCCRKGAHIGYNCPPKVSIISNLEPCNQTINNEPPQTLSSFDSTCYSDKEISVPCVSKPNFVDESSNIFNPPSQPPIYSCEFCGSNAQYGHYCAPQAPFINPEPGYSQDFNFPQGFDQTQPPQFPVIHPPPQETSIEILHDQENIEMIYSSHDSRLPLPPEERCGYSHHFIHHFWYLIMEAFDEFGVCNLTKSQEITSSAINDSWNAENPSGRRSNYSKSSRLIPLECTLVSRPEETRVPKPMVEERVKVTINPEYHEQTVMIGFTLTKKGRDKFWRMCVDCKDLNKACPKDGYPLPKIDWKVESLCGFPFKCFLDAYKGYHQIQMAKEDEEKTAFITSQRIFCYTKMPFGLRNAGATYQRLVDKAFHKQIGRNLEVYVDDLVIKSRTDDEIVRDVEETFKILRGVNMKLNPKKCTFGVEEGMFLGYKVNAKEMKLIAELPMLTAPIEKEELIVYLAAAKEAVIAVLMMTEREAKQMPIYLVSRALRGLELNYTSMERLVLALVHARMEFTYALRFRFDATNNEAEYEAMIAGIRIAEQMGVKNLQANVDSCLVANQAFSIRQVPRSENKKADTLKGVLPADEKKARALRRKSFGLPGEMISDNRKQFRDNPFKDWCEKLCIHHHFASVKHPQTNGLVERANQSLGEGIKARLDTKSKNWIEELPHVLWAHRTLIKSSNEDTPLSLTYETETVIPAEIGMPTLRTTKVDSVQTMKLWKSILISWRKGERKQQYEKLRANPRWKNTITQK
nr:reverse transcriptase domain-containing protein [Tanacetum cinerariifolium]